MLGIRAAAPDSTAVRVALWRAMHVQVDPPPHVLEDEIGLRLADPDDGWRRRPDMDRQRTTRARASIVARARFIEDLVAVQAGHGVSPVRHPRSRPGHLRPAQAGDRRWFPHIRGRPASPSGLEAPASDRARLRHPGVAAARAGRLRGRRSWWERAGGRRLRCRPAGGRGLHRCHHVPHQGGDRRHAAPSRARSPRVPRSIATFMLPLELVEPESAPVSQADGGLARAAGTPFISFFASSEMLALAREAGFRGSSTCRRQPDPALLRRQDGWPSARQARKSSWWRPP